MNTSFVDILNKCHKPSREILREALMARCNLSNVESNYITYIAGFSHYEFAKELFDEFGILLFCNKLVTYDSLQKKMHLKILINDLVFMMRKNKIKAYDNCSVLSMNSFTNIIKWRNIDGSYIDNVREEIGTLNFSQYKKYCENHIIGIREDIDSYEIKCENLIFVLHFISVPGNISVNINSLLSRVSNAFFSSSYDKMPNLSIHNLKDKHDAYPLMKLIEWNILEVENYLEVTKFLNEINGSYKLMLYQGEKINYFDNFTREILNRFKAEAISLNLGA